MDYRALIQDRKSKDRRQTVRHVICLDPDLYAELEEAQQELRELNVAAIGDRPDPAADRRMGALSPVMKGESRVAEIESRMAEVSIVGVFKAFTAEKQAERFDLLNKAREDNPDGEALVILKAARDDILLTFDHFEGPNHEPLDLGKADLEDILATWSHGEVAGLANKINRASTEQHDAPKSVRSSLLNRHSDETSPQPSG